MKLKRKENYTKLERKYDIKQKGEKVVIEELKQRLQAKAAKLKGMKKGLIDIKSTNCSCKTKRGCINK